MMLIASSGEGQLRAFIALTTLLTSLKVGGWEEWTKGVEGGFFRNPVRSNKNPVRILFCINIREIIITSPIIKSRGFLVYVYMFFHILPCISAIAKVVYTARA